MLFFCPLRRPSRNVQNLIYVSTLCKTLQEAAFLSFFFCSGASPPICFTSCSLFPAVLYGADRSKPRLVRRRGQRWPLWWGPLERKRVTGAFPIWRRNWQRVHIFLSQLWDNSTGQNHTGVLAWPQVKDGAWMWTPQWITVLFSSTRSPLPSLVTPPTPFFTLA